MFLRAKQKKLKKSLEKKILNSKENRIISSKKIETLGILTTNEISSKIDLQKEFETTLIIENSKIYSYRPYNKSNKPSFEHFSEKDIHVKGEYVELSFLNFLEQPFDLLICFFNKNNIYLECAALQSSATFKVGFSGVNPELFELEISEDIQNIGQYSLELKKYLSALNKL